MADMTARPDLNAWPLPKLADWAARAKADIDSDGQAFWRSLADATPYPAFAHTASMQTRVRGTSGLRVWGHVPAIQAEEARGLALTHLNNGCEGIAVEMLNTAPGAAAEVLEGVLMDAAPVSLAGGLVNALAARDAALARNQDAAALLIEAHVANGDEAGAVAAFLKAHPTTRWALSCGGEHEQGAGAVLELALLTHRAARWLEALADHDLPPGEALNRLSLWLHAGVHMPETLAKIRALHRLFQRVGDILEVTGRPGVHTITSQHMLSGQDPDTNMVRHACAGLAAAAGGADGLCVRAHDPHGTETQAPRVARNLALMIAHESRIAGFADPAAGSGHFEALTDRLARDAWALFQDLRTAGDGAEALAAERLGRDREAVKAYWTGRTVVGVNAYPPPEPQAPGPLEQLLGMAP